MRIPSAIFAAMPLLLAGCAKKSSDGGSSDPAPAEGQAPGVVSIGQPDAPSGGGGGIANVPVIAPPGSVVAPPTSGSATDTTAPIVVLGPDVATRQALAISPTVDEAGTVSSYAWTQVDGPGLVTFSQPDAKDTNVGASVEGVYTIRLTVTDETGNAGSDDLKLTWDLTPPTIDAGADRVVMSSFAQDATPGEMGLAFQWSKVSGPGDVFFGSATSEDTSINISADGSYVVRLRATDAAGNAATDELTVQWDTTAPTVDVGVDRDASAPVAIDATASDAIALTYAWTKVSGPGQVVFSTPTAEDTTVTLGTDGVYVVRLSVVDALGNGASDELTLTRDTTAPIAELTGAPADPSKDTTLAVTVGGADVTHYRHKVGAAASTNCALEAGYSAETPAATPIGDSVAALTDTTLRLCVVARDAGGNWQALASATAHAWTKDTAAPTATYAGEPSDPSNLTTTAITVAGTAVTHYRAKIGVEATTSCADGAGYGAEAAVAATLATSLTSLADGELRLCLVGRDAAGNWQDFAAATPFVWTKDTAAPLAEQTGAPTGISNDATLAVAVSGDQVTHYRRKLGVAATTDCAVEAGYGAETPIATTITDSVASLADGDVVLCLVGRDAAGNWQAFSAATAHPWTKDTNAPVATHTGEPSDPSSATALAVTVGGTDVTHYRHKVGVTATTDCAAEAGYGAETAVATPITASLAAFADTSLTLCLVGRDAGGNWQAFASATPYEWAKDTAAPTATQSGAPSGNSNVTTLAVTVGGTDVTHYRHKVGAASSVTCSDETGYGSETAVATPITTSIAAIADGLIRLCLVGRDAAGNWQAAGSATPTTWTKKTAAPAFSSLPLANEAANLYLNATERTVANQVAGAVVGQDYTTAEYKLVAAATACDASLTYGAMPLNTSADFGADGSYKVCVRLSDDAGNAPAYGASANFTLAATAPSVTLSSGATTVTNTSPIPVTATFSAAVTGFVSSDVSVTGGTVTAFSGSGTTYTLSVTPSGQGTVTVNVAASVATDVAGNGNTAAAPLTRTYDSVAPTVTGGVDSPSANATYTVGQAITITVGFSEAVTVTGTPSLALNTTPSRSATYTSGSGTTTLTFTYTPQAGDLAADLDQASTTALTGTIRDAAGNAATPTLPAPGASGSLAANKAIVVDTVAASVTSVDSTSTNRAYGPGAVITIRLNYSEPIAVTGTPTLALATSPARSASYVSGDGTEELLFEYTVQAGDISGDLEYASQSALALNGGTVTDGSGNSSLVLPAVGGGNSLGDNAEIQIDTAAPTISGVDSDSSDGTYSVGNTVEVAVFFDEAVAVTGTPRIALNVTPTTRYAVYNSGSGTGMLVFTYTVENQDVSADLDYASAAALQLNGGSIGDLADNAAVLTLPAPGAERSLAFARDIVIDYTLPPSLAISGTPSTTHASATTLTVTFPANTSGYEEVRILRVVGGTPPADCQTGTLVDTLTSFVTNPTLVTDSTGGAGRSYSYRVCAYDAASTLLASATAASVTSSMFHWMFTTATAVPSGNLGGLAGADAICQAAGESKDPTLTWVAVLSATEAEARGRLPISGPVYNLNPTRQTVANSHSDLWDGSIGASVQYSQTGGSITSGNRFTGTASNGSRASTNCNNWTSSSSAVTGGRSSMTTTTSSWVSNSTGACNVSSYRLLCASRTIEPLTDFTISRPTSGAEGDVQVSIDVPSDTSNWSKVEVRRSLASTTAPSCGTSTLVKTYNGPTFADDTFIDATGTPHRFYSYIVCVYSGAAVAAAYTKTLPVRTYSATATHMMFLTTTSYTGAAVGGLSGADAKCQSRGDTFVTGKTWRAVLSTSTVNANSRISSTGPIRTLSGTLVATGTADLFDGSIGAVVSTREDFGTTSTSNVWTGSTGTGDAANHCSSWTSTSGTGQRGSSNSLTSTWLSNSTTNCGNARALFCISATAD